MSAVAGEDGGAAGEDEGEPGHADELGEQPPEPVLVVCPVGVAWPPTEAISAALPMGSALPTAALSVMEFMSGLPRPGLDVG
jgi:hypothetical protein